MPSLYIAGLYGWDAGSCTPPCGRAVPLANGAQHSTSDCAPRHERCSAACTQDECARRATIDTTMQPLEFVQQTMDEWGCGHSCRSCGYIYQGGKLHQHCYARLGSSRRAWTCPGGCGSGVDEYCNCLVGTECTGQLWSVSVGTCPLQNNGYDCGVFMCQCARIVAKSPVLVRQYLPSSDTEGNDAVLGDTQLTRPKESSTDRYTNVSIVYHL